MINPEDFITRLEAIMKFYGISASGMADKIKVQRSSISHLLTGRNKPSLDFVLKIVTVFPEVDLYWLLLGKGVFPKDKEITTKDLAPILNTDSNKDESVSKQIDKIVIFYKNNSFESFTPK